MYLTKLLIRDFGKFHNKSADLQPGINLVVGNEGSGKSTIRDFIVGLIYGIPRREGITKVRSNYDLRKPQNSSGYSGTAYINIDDKSYLVDRSFLAGARKASVLDVQSGREVRLQSADTLSGTLCETDKNTFLDMKCIIEDEDRDSKRDLQEYLTNITLTGTANISKIKAIHYLENEKKNHIPKPLIRRLDELDERISEYDGVDEEIDAVDNEIKKLNEEFVMEAERRKRVARRMVENDDGSVTYESDASLDEKIDRITEREVNYGASEKAVEQEEKSKKEARKAAGKDGKEKKFTDRVPVILATGAFVILVVALIVNLLKFEPIIKKLFVIFTSLFVFLTMIDGFRAKGFFGNDIKEEEVPDEEEFQKVIEELKEEAEQQEEIEFDMTFAKEYQEKKAALKEKENQLLERRGERNRLRQEFDSVFKKKSELEEEITAIDFAINKINTLSNSFREEAFRSVLINVSEFMGILTQGDFRELTFDENGSIILIGDVGAVPLSLLDEEDAGKVSLAVRLSIAKHLAKENMPLIIDGTSALDTVTEIKALIDCLVSMKEEQIIIFTEDMGMASVFQTKNVPVNVVTL